MKKNLLLLLLLVVPFVAGSASNIKGRSRSSMKESVNVRPKKAKPIKPVKQADIVASLDFDSLSNKKVNQADTAASVAQDDDDKPIVNVQKKAQFSGGSDTLRKYLRENLTYPEEALDAGIQGTVIVSFIVRKDGTLDNVEVERSVDPSLDEEAVKVVESMPNWVPAQVDGRAVSSFYRLPVIFRLSR